MRNLFVIGAAIAAAVAVPASAEPVQDALDTLRPSVNTRILGGTAALLGAWPWQVLIFIPGSGNGGAMCGGSLIGTHWVLTAAHCFNKFNQSRPIAVLEQRGTDNAKAQLADIDGKSIHHVSKPIVHREYNDHTHENDIALLRLNEAARSQPVPLLLRPDEGLENPPAHVVITGWGWMRFVKQDGNAYFDPETHSSIPIGDVVPDRLMEVELPLVPTEECRATYGKRATIDDRTLCAGLPGGGKDSCNGDSGGPMVIHASRGSWVQTGIVSWGAGCGLKGFPGVYTRVSAFADWIRLNAARDLVVLPDEATPGAIGSPQPGTPDPEFDNAAGLAIAFDEGDEVRVGDVVSYRVTTHRPGYLVIFDATPDGKLTQVFPNAGSMSSPTGAAPEAARVRPERPRLIPDSRNPYEGFKILIREPRGKGLIVAVLSEEPITSLSVPDLPKTFAAADEAKAAIGRLRGELRQGLALDTVAGHRPKWSVAMHDYVVK
jgi:secreted trypsin-like serine protease